MQLDRDLNCFFQCCYQLSCLVRKQKTCHILDTDGVCTHLLDLFCHALSSNPEYKHHPGYRTVLPVHVLFLCWHAFTAVCRLRRSFRQSKIRMISIPFAMDFCTKYSTTSSAYGRYPRIFCPRNSICSLVFLNPSRNLRSLSHGSSFRKRKGCIESSTTPALYGMIANLIHLINDRKHLLCCHTGCNQRLMCVTQNGFCNFNRFFCISAILQSSMHLIHSSQQLYYTPKIAMKVPAATAVPITPATFGPIACISRKLVGSASAPTF